VDTTKLHLHKNAQLSSDSSDCVPVGICFSSQK